MTLSKIAQTNLLNYIQNNEVVYQVFGELVEVSNDENVQNKESLILDFNNASSVEVYQKGDNFIHEPFVDLDNWATENDTLYLLETIGTLICIPTESAIANNIEVC